MSTTLEKDLQPVGLQVVDCLANHLADAGVRRLNAQAEQAEHGFIDDDRSHVERGAYDDQAQYAGQNVPSQNASLVGADAARRQHEVTLLERRVCPRT